MSSCAQLLRSAEPHEHFAQLYGQDERSLVDNAAQYLREGLNRGQGVLVVTTGKRRDALLRRLRKGRFQTRAAIADGQLVFLDASSQLAQIMIDGQPAWDRFDATVGAAVRTLLATPGLTGLRAFGEMVGLLWSAGQRQAAIRLEAFWNRLLARHGFGLFCAYPIDVFGSEFHDAAIDPVLGAHTHVVPANSEVELAVDRALDEALGRTGTDRRSPTAAAPGAGRLRPRPPAAEASIMWIRHNLPEEAKAILDRAHGYLHASRHVRPRKRGQVKTGDAARLLGTTTRTLLFYEEEGLVRPTRTPGGTRMYSSFDLARAEVAIRLSRLGFPLKLIKALTSARSSSETGREASEKLSALFAELRRDLAGRVGALQGIAEDLERADLLVRQCAQCPHPPNRQHCPDCPCEVDLGRSALLHLTSNSGR
ncbi:MAG: MEDS domain-containing protein [Gemmatimonadales bacterium]